VRKFVRQGAHRGAYLKIWPSLEAKFRSNPRFRMLATTTTEGFYISCKFDVDIPRGCGDIAPRVLAKKRKWNQLWEFLEIIIRQKLRRKILSTMCINLGPVSWYLTHSRAARSIFENSKIYSIYPPSLAPMGASHLWRKIYLAPSALHGMWKYQHTSFKGYGNINGA